MRRDGCYQLDGCLIKAIPKDRCASETDMDQTWLYYEHSLYTDGK